MLSRIDVALLLPKPLRAWMGQYHPLDFDDHDIEDERKSDFASRERRHVSWASAVQWILFASMALYATVVTIAYRSQRRESNYVTGFTTEFTSATPRIHLLSRQFDGNLHFHPNGSSYLLQSDFSGPPCPSIDENWEKLIGKRYFYMSEEEAKTSWGKDYDGYYDLINGKKAYVGGLDILHTLHCVDQLRKLLDPEYYKDALHMSQNHNYHCIDHIRQYLMCYGDLTPVQTKWNSGKGRLYVESNMLHTCRDFSAVQEWMEERHIVYG